MNIDLGDKKPSIVTTELWLIVAAVKFVYLPAIERAETRPIDWIVCVCTTILVLGYLALRQWVKARGIAAGLSAAEIAAISDPKTVNLDSENLDSAGSLQPS